jgi:hypothetical protein
VRGFLESCLAGVFREALTGRRAAQFGLDPAAGEDKEAPRGPPELPGLAKKSSLQFALQTHPGTATPIVGLTNFAVVVDSQLKHRQAPFQFLQDRWVLSWKIESHWSFDAEDL